MNYIVSDTDMTSVADAIRTKGNTQAPLEFPSGFESAIANLGGDDSTLVELIDRSITEITIPDGVTSIGSYAFSNCINLKSIEIPSSVTSINQFAFYNCSTLESVGIPSSVRSIGSYAFSSCTLLASVTCKAITPPILGTSAFSSVPATCAIYVPAESVDTYKAASGWSNRAAYIQAIPT